MNTLFVTKTLNKKQNCIYLFVINVLNMSFIAYNIFGKKLTNKKLQIKS